MASKHLKALTRGVAVIALAATFTSTSAQAEHAVNCTGRDSNFARFVSPAQGKATVNAGPAGTISIQTPGPTPSVSLSITGKIDVVIERSCLDAMTLEVYKKGSGTPIHTNAWSLDCSHAETTDVVEIGLDAGEYEFNLGGRSCGGIGFRNTPEGGIVGDPPIL